MATKQDYLKFLKWFFEKETPEMEKENHARHLLNPDYWNKLISNKKGTVLDFGCGCGRNLLMLQKENPDSKIFGVDISKPNLEVCRKLANLWEYEFELIENSGNDIPYKKDSVDHIISTITLQHIASYEIRFDILKEMHRVLKKGGKITLQMGFGDGHPNVVGYFENRFDATDTNSGLDVKIESKTNLINDLAKIGFKRVQLEIVPSFSDLHNDWVFIYAEK